MSNQSLDTDNLYTEEQKDEIIRLWNANPAKGRKPETLAKKVQALRKRGIAINVPPFTTSPSDLSETIASGNNASEAHKDWRNERISKSLSKANMAAGQSASANCKRAKSEVLIAQYKQAHGLKEEIKPTAAQVAGWALESGRCKQDEKLNLLRRLKTTKQVT